MRLPIDSLICNAGYLGGGNNRVLINGIEKHFVVNHLGHFIFVNRLLDRLYIADQARVVVVASRTAYTRAPDEGILFDDLDFSDEYGDLLAYGHSKLANVLFSLQLAQMLRGTRITSNSLHPGLIDTEIDRHFNSVMQFGMKMMAAVRGKTIAEGAATSCYVATSASLSTTSGAYFEDCNAVTVEGDNHLYDLPMSSRLMQVSAELTADYLVEQKLPTRENPFNDPRKE
jgi:NAD(P)-dependent dehydrogenase (short-subunit alcohol dehydrogenase family)